MKLMLDLFKMNNLFFSISNNYEIILYIKKSFMCIWFKDFIFISRPSKIFEGKLKF